MNQIVGWVVFSFAAIGGVVLCWGVIRFGLVSDRRLRGARKYLRTPDIETISRLVGKTSQDEVVAFYETAPWLEGTEIALAESLAEGARVWEIGEFIPPTHGAIGEWQAILGLTDLPLATDQDKGYYFLSADGPILFRPPGYRTPTEMVAPSISRFGRFIVVQPRSDEENGAA